MADRDLYFDKDWNEIVVDLAGYGPATIPLSPSFWRRCSEVRSAEIGQWLIDAEVAPWRKGNPPGIVVAHVDGNRFTAKVHVRKTLDYPGPGG